MNARDNRPSRSSAVAHGGAARAGDLVKLPRRRLVAMQEAGWMIAECYRVLEKTGDNVVGEVLRDQGTFYEWDHYPKGDVYDRDTHSQYYYHAHAESLRRGEHGHFHTFLRPKGMPSGIGPADLPDSEAPPDDNAAVSHLVAISMDRAGYPIRLFTTNRWVTGETWYPADAVIIMLDRFAIDHARPSWPVNLWLTCMLRLFRPQIEQLLRQRDAVVAAWQKQNPDRYVYEDRALEITAEMEISVDDQIASVEAALAEVESTAPEQFPS